MIFNISISNPSRFTGCVSWGQDSRQLSAYCDQSRWNSGAIFGRPLVNGTQRLICISSAIICFWNTLELCTQHKRHHKNLFDLGGTWTHSLWLRRPTPYPLGHKAYHKFVKMIHIYMNIHLSSFPRAKQWMKFCFICSAIHLNIQNMTTIKQQVSWKELGSFNRTFRTNDTLIGWRFTRRLVNVNIRACIVNMGMNFVVS